MFDLHFKARQPNPSGLTRRAQRSAIAALLVTACGPVAALAQTTSPSPDFPNPTDTTESQQRLTKAPELLEFVKAVPADGAPEVTERSAVMLEISVLEDGTVRDIKVLSSVHPELDRAAVEAVRQFVFAPAEVNGEPAAVRIRYEYVYEPEPLEEASSRQETAPASEGDAERAPQQVEDEPTGRIEGRLLEHGSRQPLVGATVEIPALGAKALTDAEGRFAFDGVPVGDIEVVVTDASHTSIVDVEQVRPDTITEVTYYAEQAGDGGDDLVATAHKIEKQVAVRKLSQHEIETIPGTNGDALKAVQNLPGVARTTGDQIILRGGGKSRVLVNGHPIPTAFHFGGLRSTVGNGMLGSLEVTPGNYDAQYGGANGGIVDIQTRRPSSDALHGYAQVDLFDGGAFLEGPLGKHGTFALGGRRSWIDIVLASALDDESVSFPGAPRYCDYQGTYDWKKGDHRLRLNAFGSADSMVMLFEEPDANDPAMRGDLGYSSKWVTGQVLWDYRPNDKTQYASSVSYLREKVGVSLGQDIDLDYTDHLVTLRSEARHELAHWATARIGLDATATRTKYYVASPRPPQEGEPATRLAGREILRTEGEATLLSPAAYAAMDLQVGSVLLIPALRVDHFENTEANEQTTLVQPRIDLRWAVTNTTVAKAGVGLYSEPVGLEYSNEVFGTPGVAPERSTHYSAGLEQQLAERTSIDVVGFYKDLYQQISLTEDPAINYDNSGRGRVFGAEFLLRHDSSRFHGWAAYTLSRSERKMGSDRAYRLSEFDQTHNLTIVGQYQLATNWELGARFRYVTGSPTTPVVDSTFDSDADAYSPVYGRINSTRLDDFHQLDVRVDKHWVFKAWKLSAYLDVQNAYNHQNTEGIAYNYDYSKSKPVTGLPFVPSFGLRGEF